MYKYIFILFFLFSCANVSEQIKEASKESDIVIVDFYGERCHACKRIEPYLDSLQSNNEDIQVLKIDIESDDSIIHIYDIKIIPTVLYFYKGEEVIRMIGYCEEEEYIENLTILKSKDI